MSTAVFQPPTRLAAFLVALVLDALLGEPPTALHPVGWFGRLIAAVERVAPAGAVARRRFGTAVAAGGPVVAVAAGLGLRRAFGGRGVPALLAEAVVLDVTFAQRALLARAEEVRAALVDGDLPAARAILRTHLVSRDVESLTAAEVAGATIESVAENLGDGVVAPWLAYAVGGGPAALAYRAVNTLDAMWGYRTERYEDLGRAGARLDDVANWIPARVTALAIVVAAAAAGEDTRGAVRAWRRDAHTTASPNAGRPMAAMAGALGLTLTKRGAYRLGAGREPGPGDITRAVRLARVAGWGVAMAIAAWTARIPCTCRGGHDRR